MNFWVGFIVGAVIMSIFACMAIIASDNDHPILTTIFLGPLAWFIVGSATIYSGIGYLYRTHTYYSLLIKDGKYYYAKNKRHEVDTLMEFITYKFPKQDPNSEDWKEIKEKYGKYWNKKYCSMGFLNFRYTPKKVVKLLGATPVFRSEVEFALKKKEMRDNAWKYLKNTYNKSNTSNYHTDVIKNKMESEVMEKFDMSQNEAETLVKNYLNNMLDIYW